MGKKCCEKKKCCDNQPMEILTPYPNKRNKLERYINRYNHIFLVKTNKYKRGGKWSSDEI